MGEKTFLVFDVESIGVFGVGFAVGWVVVDGYGEEIESGFWGCPPDHARSSLHSESRDRDWVDLHVVPHLPPANLPTPYEVRRAFWKVWTRCQAQGARLAADVAWPVEADFLLSAVQESGEGAQKIAPYPLIDIASVLLAAGLDPVGTMPRLTTEEPAHNPVNDARQSARLLVQALQRLKVLSRREEAGGDS